MFRPIRKKKNELTPEDAIEVVRKFAAKYYPNEELIEEEVKASGKAVQMFEITIDHMSGKEIQEI